MGTLANKDSTCKSTYSLIVQHVLVKFIALAIRHLMINQRIVVHTLLLVCHHTPIHVNLCILATKGNVCSIASQTIVERNGIDGG